MIVVEYQKGLIQVIKRMDEGINERDKPEHAIKVPQGDTIAQELYINSVSMVASTSPVKRYTRFLNQFLL